MDTHSKTKAVPDDINRLCQTDMPSPQEEKIFTCYSCEKNVCEHYCALCFHCDERACFATCYAIDRKMCERCATDWTKFELDHDPAFLKKSIHPPSCTTSTTQRTAPLK